MKGSLDLYKKVLNLCGIIKYGYGCKYIRV